VTLGYRFSRKVHSLAFTPGKGLFKLGTRFYKKRQAKQDGLLSRMAYTVERASKSIGFGCKDCGDCSLPDCAYLCPRASCSKGSRNGPCGGSHNGRCELDDKECLWARAYDRLKYYGESEHFLEGPAVFTDAKLEGSSSWANMYLGRDHHHAVQPEPPPAAPAEAPKPQQPDKPST
jgi:methylenetetrahydrofolate reductase (NADPH)